MGIHEKYFKSTFIHSALWWASLVWHKEQSKLYHSDEIWSSFFPQMKHMNISIFRLRCCPCPILWGWQHQAMSNTGSLYLCLVYQHQLGHTCWHQSSHIQTMSNQAFLSRQCREWESLWGMWYRTWPYHLSRRQRRTDVISSISSLYSSEAEGVSSVFDVTDPMDHGTVILAEQLRFRFIWSPLFTTMEHSRANAGLVHLATYPRCEVSGG